MKGEGRCKGRMKGEGRCNNQPLITIRQHMDLFGVIDDALLVYLGPTKGDQDGSKHTDHPWHIYSVPDKPEICPCIAFAEYLMSNPMVLDGECKVFDGASQYERYNNIMRDIVRSDEYCDAFKKLGLSPDHFGTHSIRKGAITHAACGTTVSITWRTCHERFSGRRGLFRQLGIGRGS
jgi:hypothetical protein